MSIKEQSVMDAIKSLASQILPKGAKLILFGSRARGDAREDSDWDLLVLIDKDSNATADEFGSYSYPFSELGFKLNEEINPLFFTTKQWEQQRTRSLFYHNVLEEGIVLWA